MNGMMTIICFCSSLLLSISLLSSLLVIVCFIWLLWPFQSKTSVDVLSMWEMKRHHSVSWISCIACLLTIIVKLERELSHAVSLDFLH